MLTVSSCSILAAATPLQILYAIIIIYMLLKSKNPRLSTVDCPSRHGCAVTIVINPDSAAFRRAFIEPLNQEESYREIIGLGLILKLKLHYRWLHCVECSEYSIRLEALGYLCASCLLRAFDAA